MYFSKRDNETKVANKVTYEYLENERDVIDADSKETICNVGFSLQSMPTSIEIKLIKVSVSNCAITFIFQAHILSSVGKLSKH